jgi:hypothetical protein
MRASGSGTFGLISATIDAVAQAHVETDLLTPSKPKALKMPIGMISMVPMPILMT